MPTKNTTQKKVKSTKKKKTSTVKPSTTRSSIKSIAKSTVKSTTKSTTKSGNKKSAPSSVDFYKLLQSSFICDHSPDVELVNKGQYKIAFDLLEDAQACQLTPILIGPPGTGKTLLARSFAAAQNRDFEWMTMDEATKPTHFVGSFDPGETLKRGFVKEAFLPGPLTKMMVVGGIFLANELNRATEYCQNSFLEPLEERSLLLPRLGRIKAKDDFFLICAANPSDMAGTHRLSEALKDRIKVWIKLDYPSRAVEMDIIHANIPHSKLSKDYLNLTYELIAATRKNRDIERPASIRSAIAIAKMAGLHQQKNKNLKMKKFKEIAQLVLSGGIKPRPGQDAEKIIKNIVSTVAK
ncbi:AAA family ATPase [Candidatus Harpocratesius sp.]